MPDLKRIAFVCESFRNESPALLLMDRFLMGYPLDGKFVKPPECEMTVYCGDKHWQSKGHLERRNRDHGVTRTETVEEAVANADGVVVIREDSLWEDERLTLVLKEASRRSRCFVYGPLARDHEVAQELLDRAKRRRIILAAGSWVPTTWWLPPLQIPQNIPMKEALIVVQGNPLTAAWHGLQGILPILEKRLGGETGLRRIRLLKNQEVWRAGADGYWSYPLLAAALSRSHTPQGDPVEDGRPQDLVGLRLVRDLVKSPRGWWMEHRDGMRTTILVLDGAVKDYNFAIQTQDRQIMSAQIFATPDPMHHSFSNLAAVVTDFFVTGEAPWPMGRSLLEARALGTMRRARTIYHEGIDVPATLNSRP